MEQTVGLVADVGRVSVGFGLSIDGRAPERVERFATADHTTFTDALTTYLNLVGMQDRALPSVLAIAGAAHGGLIAVTGSRWYISLSGIEAVLRAPARALNECAANALALTTLSSSNWTMISGTPIERLSPSGNYLLVGPGTGLGVAALVPAGNRLIPVQSEAAHMNFLPATDDERSVAAQLSRMGGAISSEAIVSGGGLLAAYSALGGRHAQRAEDVTRGLGRDPVADRAVALFLGAWGAVIGDLVLAFAAWDGVFLTGGIARALQHRLAGSTFRTRLQAKSAFRRQLGDVPIVVVNRNDLELLGAAAALNAG
jgi:glucokinase